MSEHRIFSTSFASVYPHYVAKAEKKGRSRAEVDAIIGWLTAPTSAASSPKPPAPTQRAMR